MDYAYLFAAGCTGAAAATMGWHFFVGRHHARVVKDLLSENGGLHADLKEAAYWRDRFNEEASGLYKRLAPFVTPRKRDARGLFQKEAA